VKAALGALLRGKRLRHARAALAACLEALARSPAWLLSVNLEDLWGEEEPQNVPGTALERPNWKRKSRLSLEEIRNSAPVGRMLHRIRAWRAPRRSR
jgi:4-alpha-glucanotransferase